ncbi:hypothetical protein JR316_0006435 [Psilocybe cubensis]|uniref:Uncharacterized protein n=1 Tax=Psilocybe cubensis TaxID=181762 RepID=A0ACB8H2F5_PSICU|nr:hypothetical protein JR316_0006435 [Psilocybe cubensis]KAH9481905.1 hypothetical protein JR316_0006435 [Psilocybe cubensis]
MAVLSVTRRLLAVSCITSVKKKWRIGKIYAVGLADSSAAVYNLNEELVFEQLSDYPARKREAVLRFDEAKIQRINGINDIPS